jgi:hypothetical protein
MNKESPIHCEDLFLRLAKEDPHQLADMINNNALKPYDLTYAAEYLGAECNDSNLVRKTLVPLLDHPEAVVREGALIGLNQTRLYDEDDHIDEATEKIIEKMSSDDPSPCIREFSKQIVEDFYKKVL